MKKKITKTPKKAAVCVDKVGAQRDIWFKQTPKRPRFARVKSGFLKKNKKASVAPPKPRLLKPL